jgi:hypothetical protein
MKSLHNLGIISDAEMRKFDQDCLVSTPKKSAIKVSPQPEEITPITA